MQDKEKPRKIDEAKRILGMSTENETEEQAPDLLAFHREVIDGIDRITGKGLIRDIDATQ